MRGHPGGRWHSYLAPWWLTAVPMRPRLAYHLHASHRCNMSITHRDELIKACCTALNDMMNYEQQVELGKLLSCVANLPDEMLGYIPRGSSNIAIVTFLRTQMAGWYQ